MYVELKLQQQAGKITGLRCQRSFKLAVNGILVCRYRADFDFVEDGKWIVVDVKGWKTPEYKLKKSLMFAVHGIEIRET